MILNTTINTMRVEMRVEARRRREDGWIVW